MHPYTFLFKNLKLSPCPPQAPATQPCWNLPDTVNTHASKKLSKMAENLAA